MDSCYGAKNGDWLKLTAVPFRISLLSCKTLVDFREPKYLHQTHIYCQCNCCLGRRHISDASYFTVFPKSFSRVDLICIFGVIDEVKHAFIA